MEQAERLLSTSVSKDDLHRQACAMYARAHRLEAEALELMAEWGERTGDFEPETIAHMTLRAKDYRRMAEQKDLLGQMSASEAKQLRLSV